MASKCPQCSAQVPSGSQFCQDCGSSVKRPTARAQSAAKANRKRAGASGLYLAVGGLLAVALVALLLMRPGGGGVAKLSHEEMMSHLRTEAGPVPAWLASSSRMVVTEYTWAVDHHEELQYIPCYCGCYQSAGHTSNYNCYFGRTASGTVAGYDPHSYG